MTTIDRVMWANLLTLAKEATDGCEPDEREWMIHTIENDPVGSVTYEVDADDRVHLYVGGRRLVSAHRLALTRPVRAAPTNTS
jgi:hypothetical protein